MIEDGDWPRDPASLARELYDRCDEVLIRSGGRGQPTAPLHVPATDLARDLDLEEGQLTDHTPLCVGSSKPASEPNRKSTDVYQPKVVTWCSECCERVLELRSTERINGPVRVNREADAPIVEDDNDGAGGTCPFCGEAYPGFLPGHLEECPERENVARID